jgi:hypothetical protein
VKLLAVLPVLTRTYADRAVASIVAPDSAFGLPPEEILVVDNTRDGSFPNLGLPSYRDPEGHNLGVARSWNVGARRVLEEGLDYLVVVSASMLFGPILHTTWRWQLETFFGAPVIEADGHSWHLIAFHRSAFERVGLFDENFYPGYFEAIDFGRRLALVGLEGGWPRPWVNALSQGAALHNAVVSTPADPLLAYYAEKWGGAKGSETFDRPWGDQAIDFFPDRSIPELAEAYGLEVWW